MRIVVSWIAAALLLVAAPAHAAVFSARYSGTLDFIEDQTGLFGGAKAGDPFSLVFTLDTAVPAIVAEELPGFVDYRSDFTPKLVTAVLAINGHVLHFAGDQSAAFQAAEGGNDPQGHPNDLIGASSSDLINSQSVKSVSAYVESAAHDFIVPSILDAAFDYAIQPSDHAVGGFTYIHNTPDSGPLVYSYGFFNVERVVFAAVPELSGWAMLVLGLGAIGAVSRAARARTSTSDPVR